MLVLFILCTLGGAYTLDLQVNTTEGPIKGVMASDGKYAAFYGIPYGGPTDGQNRFKAPTPPSIRSTLFYANNSNIRCAQPNGSSIIGEENCLTLNIFTNETNASKPVMIWLDAEDYTTSTQPQSFKKFVDKGIVAVSINFRLSIFGFLCLGVPEAPGNAGIHDAIQAIKWIRKNIAAFGGDPDNVALVGHSSAVAIVDIIVNSDRATNLAKRAIAISGSALAPWAVAYDPIGYAYMLGAKLNFTNSILKRSDLAKLFASTDISHLSPGLNGIKFFNNTPLFAPCLENTESGEVGKVLTQTPFDVLNNGTFDHIPYLAIYASKEGTIREKEARNNNWLKEMQANFTEFLPVDLDYTNKSLVEKIIKYYFKENTMNETISIDKYFKYEGDILVEVPVINAAAKRAAKSKSDVWLLEFDYTRSANDKDNVIVNGAKHGDILHYLFEDVTKENRNITDIFFNSTVSFIKNGNMTWQPIAKNGVFYYSIFTGDENVTNSELKSDPKYNTMKFWKKVYSNNYAPPKIIPKSGSSSSIRSSLAMTCAFILGFIMFQ